MGLNGDDGSEVEGKECKELDTNRDTTAYLTSYSGWIVSLFVSLSPELCLQKIANRPHCVKLQFQQKLMWATDIAQKIHLRHIIELIA